MCVCECVCADVWACGRVCVMQPVTVLGGGTDSVDFPCFQITSTSLDYIFLGRMNE